MSKSPFENYPPPEIVSNPDEIEHAFEIDGIQISVFVAHGAGLEWLVNDDDAPFDFSSKNQAFRDQLQKEIDIALKKLRAKHGKPVWVWGVTVPRAEFPAEEQPY